MYWGLISVQPYQKESPSVVASMKEDLLAGIHRALAAQINSLAERMGVEQDVAMVGGGARDMGLVQALKEIREHDILVPLNPHLTAALGAAIIAVESLGQ